MEPISFPVSLKTSCLWSQWSLYLEIYLRNPEITEKGEKPEGNKREEHRGQNRSHGGRGCPSPGEPTSTQEWHQLGARSWSPVRNALRLHMVNFLWPWPHPWPSPFEFFFCVCGGDCKCKGAPKPWKPLGLWLLEGKMALGKASSFWDAKQRHHHGRSLFDGIVQVLA